MEETFYGGGGDEAGAAGGGDELLCDVNWRCPFLGSAVQEYHAMNVPSFEPGDPNNEGKREVQDAKTYPNRNTPTLATLLGRQTMRDTEIGTPVAATDGDDAEFCDDDGGADGGCDFLACFDAEADVAFGVADDDDGLEAGTLSGAGLLLDGFDLCEEGDQGVSLNVQVQPTLSHRMYVDELEAHVVPIIYQPSHLHHNHTQYP